MPNVMLPSHKIARCVLQDAARLLAQWAGINAQDLRANLESPSEAEIAKELIGWSTQTLSPLQLVFNSIHLNHESIDATLQPAPTYRPAWALETERVGSERHPRIPYAQPAPSNGQSLDSLRAKIRAAIATLDWQNLAQLTLFVEKFGSHLSAGDPDIALIDLARSTAAIAAALAQQPPGEKLALIGGDLMGVQKFIYTISSEGALKSLRARSFYLELAAEEVVQQILTELNLPRTNVIYAGASKFYLLVAATDELETTLERIQSEFNEWLLETFQRKVFLAIALEPFPAAQLKTVSSADSTTIPLAQIWQNVNDQLTTQASRKFANQLDAILKTRNSHQPCKVCHRDDVRRLTRLNREEANSVEACSTCARMFRLGRQLLQVKAIVRSSRLNLSPQRLRFKLKSGTIYYYLFDDRNEAFCIADSNDSVLLVNDWEVAHYQTPQTVPLLYANYGQSSEVEFEENDRNKPSVMRAEEFAQKSQGIQRVGYLRMDVDRLSQIFSKGLGQGYTLPRLACLSRQMTYFFKVYLNSLADARQPNFINHCDSLGFKYLPHKPPQDSKKGCDKNLRKNLLFIYAGGDDLFVSGAWDETVEFAFDVYQAFRAYTGQHPDITLSAGICIAGAKFPLYQAADEAGEVEKTAKGNGRDSFAVFDTALKWDEWLGNWNPKALKDCDREYLNSVTKPELFGVFPFVEKLFGEVGQGYTRSFVRNLLNTAQVQEEKIKEAKENHPDQVQDIRYYLHLPKVAYTLARLPNNILDDSDFRKSLKSPYNAPYFRAIATWIELLNR